MTEEEAKQKWCPMVRASISQGDGNASNRDCHRPNEAPEYAQCIGSKCMMWTQIKQLFDVTHNSFVEKVEHTGWEYEMRFNGGYCGLAGKP